MKRRRLSVGFSFRGREYRVSADVWRGELMFIAFLVVAGLFLPTLLLSFWRSAEESNATIVGDEAIAYATGLDGSVPDPVTAVARIHRLVPSLPLAVDKPAAVDRLPAGTVVIVAAPKVPNALVPTQSVFYVRSSAGTVYRGRPGSYSTSGYYEDYGYYHNDWQTVRAPGFPWDWTLGLGLLLALAAYPFGIWLTARAQGGDDDSDDGDDDPDPSPTPDDPSGLVPDFPPDFDTLPPGPKEPEPERELTPA